MKNNKVLRFVFMFLVVIFLGGCGDKIKLNTIAPNIDTYQTYEITNYMGHLVNMELTDKEIESIKEDMLYFYECKYYAADTTRTPMVQLRL